MRANSAPGICFAADMTNANRTVELAMQLAVLEGRLKTMRAECQTDIARLAEMNAVGLRTKIFGTMIVAID